MTGTQYDAPNQQVVRPDGSGPWQEGDGGSVPPDPEPQPKPEAKTTADKAKAKTKNEPEPPK